MAHSVPHKAGCLWANGVHPGGCVLVLTGVHPHLADGQSTRHPFTYVLGVDVSALERCLCDPLAHFKTAISGLIAELLFSI